MKKTICMLCTVLAITIPSSSLAHIWLERKDIPNDFLNKIERKTANALSCASHFGSVRNVRVDAIKIRDNKKSAVVLGSYQMQGFWGVTPATFRGNLVGSEYTYIDWEEVNGLGRITGSCLE